MDSNEEFYDSLDEEVSTLRDESTINDGSITNSPKTTNSPLRHFLNSLVDMFDHKCQSNILVENKLVEIAEVITPTVPEIVRNSKSDLNVASMIPLYSGEIEKQVYEDNLPPKKALKIKSCIDLVEPPAKNGKNHSYLNIFRSRANTRHSLYASGKKKPLDTVRSIYDNSKDEEEQRQQIIVNDEGVTARSEKYNNSPSSDSTSCYIRFLPELNQSRKGMRHSTPLAPKLDITQTASSLNDSTRSTNTIIKDVKKNNSLLKAPILGGLGPDFEASKNKLEMKRKQLQYGQKVSQRNRLRIKEKQVLNELKREMNRSAVEDNMH